MTAFSREAGAFAAAAAAGRFRLQRCAACGAWAWPAREACPACWGDTLAWEDAPAGGEMLATSTVHHSLDPWFAARLPWRIGLVKLDAGPVALVHRHESAETGARVRLLARTDMAGRGVLIALPETGDSTMSEEAQLGHLACDPAGRTVLVTDIGTVAGKAVAAALVDAGAARVCGGAAGAEAAVPDGVDPVDLDPADPATVRSVADSFGDSLDVVVFTGGGAWTGAALGPDDLADAEDEMAINYFHLLRLARAFAPRLRERAAEPGGAACAWVNLLSVHALCGAAGFGTSAASQAAAWSLSQALRRELSGTGVRVIDILCAPIEAEGASGPPPRVKPAQVGRVVVTALREGLDRAAAGVVAEDMLKRYEENPMALEREALRS